MAGTSSSQLGHGCMSTIWLAHDIKDKERFSVLKIPCAEDDRPATEEAASNYLKSKLAKNDDFSGLWSTHGIRLVEQSYVLPGIQKKYEHHVLVYAPTGGSVNALRRQCRGRIPKPMLRQIIKDVLSSLVFMHETAKVAHGDLYAGNVLCELADPDETCHAFQKVEQRRASRSAVQDGHRVYESRHMDNAKSSGRALLADLGAAFRFSANIKTPKDALPDELRAPEVVLGCVLGERLDIWALGLVFWLLHFGKVLMRYSTGNRSLTRGTHLVWLLSILGLPNVEELAWMNKYCNTRYAFDGESKLAIGDGEGPPCASLEEAAELVTGQGK